MEILEHDVAFLFGALIAAPMYYLGDAVNFLLGDLNVLQPICHGIISPLLDPLALLTHLNP